MLNLKALESSVTAEMVQTETLAMSYGALGLVNGTTKFVSSTAASPIVGFGLAAALMIAGTLAMAQVSAKHPS